MSQLHVIVVTPEATVVDAKTHFVAIPFYDGEMGVAIDHAPVIGRLGYGELRFEDGGRTERYFIDGGFVQIADNIVSIMADRAMPAAELKVDDARAMLDQAIGETASGEQLALRERKVAQARAMVRVADRQAVNR